MLSFHLMLWSTAYIGAQCWPSRSNPLRNQHSPEVCDCKSIPRLLLLDYWLSPRSYSCYFVVERHEITHTCRSKSSDAFSLSIQMPCDVMHGQLHSSVALSRSLHLLTALCIRIFSDFNFLLLHELDRLWSKWLSFLAYNGEPLCLDGC